MSEAFPLGTVVGVLAGKAEEVTIALERLEQLAKNAAPETLGVEVRADLLDSPDAALELLARLPAGVRALFTIRLERQGGAFRGGDEERLALFRAALARGAVLVDVEWSSEAARALSAENAPLIISHHDFDSMFNDTQLEKLTRDATTLSPRAIKLIPTARSPRDGLRMLEWVAGATADGPHRIGFAMGEEAFFSRVLAPAWGAPITYGALGNAVAPGQASAADLLELYQVPRLSAETRTLGVIGNPISHSLSPHMHNAGLAERGIDAVYLPFLLASFDDLKPLVGPLRVDGLSVTIPFKEDAFRYAAENVEERARRAGAANTLVFRPDGAGTQSVGGYNTDFDGVLGPLARRGISPAGLTTAIIGNGGASRGAAAALCDAGADVTLYYRNPDRGAPVARDLGVAGKPLSELAGNERLIVNATPLGLKPGDASPIPEGVFTSDSIAFDMVYGTAVTPFIQAAQAAGATCIHGKEMLVEQGLVQFELFTGRRCSYETFETGLLRGATE